MSGLLGAIAGPVLDIASGVWSSERNRSQANAARDWQKYMWDLNNSYNTPNAQKQRMIDAGMNPALMYQTQPQNTASMPSGGAGGQSDMKINPQSAMVVAQLDNLKANTEATKADTERKWYDLERSKIDSPMKTTGLGYDNEGKNINNQINSIERAHREESLILKNAGLDLSNQQTKQFISQMSETFKNSMSKMLAEIQNIQSQTALNKGGIGLQNANIDATKMRTLLDKYESMARSEGWSYSDNVLFRQIVAALGAIGKEGKGDGNNTSMVRSIANMLGNIFN